MSESPPTVSVVLPAFNAAATVGPAIQSVVDQTFVDWELIVVDDGSSDDTAEIVRRYGARDHRVRLLPNPTNMGISRSLNAGVEAARGTWIARMDGDDESLPERLRKQMDFAAAHPSVDVIGCLYQVFDDDPSAATVSPRHDRYFRADGVRDGRVPVPHPTALIRAEVFRAHGGYRTTHRHAEDHELFARWFALGVTFGIVPEHLYRYRIHAGSITSASSAAMVRASLRVNIRALMRDRVHFRRLGYLQIAKQLGYLGVDKVGLGHVLRRR